MGREEFYFQLAEHYAPVIIQGQGADPRGDVFTKFDFDGDMDAYNNWEDLEKFPTPAFVYYDVIESRTDYFITYAFFYPRDYKATCIPYLCHENDFEGMRITVQKSMISPYGKIVLLETMAHGYHTPDLHPQVENARVKIILEKEGHGVHSPNYYAADPKTKKWTYGADGYGLLPLIYFWDHRDSLGPGHMFAETKFDFVGARYKIEGLPNAFGGTMYAKEGANPMWSWEAKGSGVTHGEWFLDPIYTVCRVSHCDSSFSQEYVYHPYLGIKPQE